MYMYVEDREWKRVKFDLVLAQACTCTTCYVDLLYGRGCVLFTLATPCPQVRLEIHCTKMQGFVFVFSDD